MQLDMEEFVKDVAAAVGIPARYMSIGQPWGYPSWRACLVVPRITTRERKRERRASRKAARDLVRGGTLFNARAPVGSIPWSVARWHLRNARNG